VAEPPAYLTDLKNLLGELRELNKALRDLAGKDKEPPKAVAKKIEATLAVLGAGGRKFIESYADLLGNPSAYGARRRFGTSTNRRLLKPGASLPAMRRPSPLPQPPASYPIGTRPADRP
jgi:hypothetical protein